MTRIFISYRRADSQNVTDRLYDHMLIHFGDGNVFQDVDKIPFGVDFRKYLSDEIAKADVVLVVIGSDWTRIMQERANQVDDFVRIEVENALNQNKLVIPVLVKGGEMPAADDIPESIHELCFHNAARVRPNPDFKRDCKGLADGIKEYFGTQSPQPAESVRAQPVAPKKSMSSAVMKPTELLNKVKKLLPPPFDWCEIPAGKVTLEAGGYVPKGGQTYDVPAFYIAKYPVTNAQFARFFESGGYNQPKWWTSDGWKQKEKNSWLEPRFWRNTKWNGADYPVVGVSWYEAMVFCLWLSDIIGERISLPTEQQWQRAAQGDDGRVYPWGDIWEASRCNNGVDRKTDDLEQSGRTNQVTQYLNGSSPYGVLDMSGNVWNWCLNDWEKGSTNIELDNNRILRGGSWREQKPEQFLVTHRLDFPPASRGPHIGFRICLNHPSL